VPSQIKKVEKSLNSPN